MSETGGIDYKKKAMRSVVAMSISSMFLCSFGIVGVVMLGDIATQCGTDTTQAAFFFTFFALAQIIMAANIGAVIARIGTRGTIILGDVLNIVAYVLMATTSNIYVVWVCGFIGGLAMLFGCGIVLQIFITQWFTGNTGKLVTFSAIPQLIGTAVFSPILATLNANFGYSVALGGSAIVLSGLALIINAIFAIKAPADYGTTPIVLEGKSPESGSDGAAQQSASQFELAMPNSQIVKIPSLWLALLVPLTLTFVLTMVTSNASLIYQSMGNTAIDAAFGVSAGSIAGAVIVPVFGSLSDSIGPKKTITLMAAVGCVDCLCFCIGLFAGFVGMIVFAVLFQVCNIGSYFSSIVMPKLFGTSKAPTLIGWGTTASSLGGMFAAPVASALAAASAGSYVPIVLACAVCFALTIVIVNALLSDKVAADIRERDKRYVAEHPEAAASAK